jgi:DNA-binding XRE family transcriptional regulator
MWRAFLRLQGLEVIYFDSYAADYFDDPFVSFSGEILELVDKHFSEANGSVERREFKKTAVEVGKRLAGLATKIGLRAATLGAIEPADVEELKELRSDIAEGVSDIGADIIGKKIEDYGKEKDALKSFKDSLAKVAAKVRKKQNFPLTIIVDELDRCRPSFALELLERIKHLFDVDNLVFVLLVNRDQIESYIKTVYGAVDARAYLHKFGSVFIDLPNEQVERSFVYVKGDDHYCQLLANYYGLSNRTPHCRYLTTCLINFARHFNLTLREIERVFGVLTVFYASVVQGTETESNTEVLIALLSVLAWSAESVGEFFRFGEPS